MKYIVSWVVTYITKPANIRSAPICVDLTLFELTEENPANEHMRIVSVIFVPANIAEGQEVKL